MGAVLSLFLVRCHANDLTFFFFQGNLEKTASALFFVVTVAFFFGVGAGGEVVVGSNPGVHVGAKKSLTFTP